MNSGVSFVRRMNDGPRAEVLEDVWFVFVHVHVFRRIIWGKMYELHDSLPFRCDCTQLSSLPWPLPHIDSNLLSYALIDRGRVKRRGWFCITYYYACFGTGFSYLIYPVLLCGNMGGGVCFNQSTSSAEKNQKGCRSRGERSWNQMWWPSVNNTKKRTLIGYCMPCYANGFTAVLQMVEVFFLFSFWLIWRALWQA